MRIAAVAVHHEQIAVHRPSTGRWAKTICFPSGDHDAPFDDPIPRPPVSFVRPVPSGWMV